LIAVLVLASGPGWAIAQPATGPAVPDLETGFTIGAGTSTFIGRMFRVPREELTYSGD
jgi:hypothetical protein